MVRLLEEKLFELEERREFFEASDRVGAALQAKGITEEEILADFEKFREKLYREQREGNHRG